MTNTTICKNKIKSKSTIIIAIGIIIFLCALALHPWDQEWRNFVLKYDFLQGKGTILRSVLSVIVSFGKGACVAFLILLAAARGYRKKAIRIFVSIAIMTIIVWSLKVPVHRERPNKKNNVSFPSGDTATASALLGTVAIQSPTLAPALILAPLVGFCRTYSDWHYLSDVVAGLACGIIAVGIAGFVRFKKLKLMENIKPRYYTIAIILLLFATLLPPLLGGGGAFLDFFEFYGPTSIILLAASYSSVFVFKHTAKNNIFAKIFRIKRAVNNYFYQKINNGKCKICIYNKVSGSIVIVFAFLMLHFSWTTIYLQKMRLSTSGLAIGMLTTVYVVWKQNRNPKNKRTAIYTLINSIAILLFLFLILFLPSLYRNNWYYTQKIHQPQHSLINQILK